MEPELQELPGIQAQILQTKDDGRLIFNTASAGSATERMRIDSSGNVGIGTSSISAPLHIDNPGDTSITQFLKQVTHRLALF